jgi:hypothetical protein
MDHFNDTPAANRVRKSDIESQNYVNGLAVQRKREQPEEPTGFDRPDPLQYPWGAMRDMAYKIEYYEFLVWNAPRDNQ